MQTAGMHHRWNWNATAPSPPGIRSTERLVSGPAQPPENRLRDDRGVNVSRLALVYICAEGRLDHVYANPNGNEKAGYNQTFDSVSRHRGPPR